MRFTCIATDEGKASWIIGHAAKLIEYLKNHAGQFMLFEVKPAYKKKDNPKTAAQLGFFFGILLDEIHKQLIADGHTTKIKFGEIEKEIPITKDSAYEAITALCGNVGENGKHLRLSDCGLRDCMKWLDNVMDLVAQLNMDLDELKKIRPK